MFFFFRQKNLQEREWLIFRKTAYIQEKLRAKRERSLLEGKSTPDILRELLPKPFACPQLSLSFDLTPFHSMGGDFLDFIWIDKDHVGFYLFDIAGHDEELGEFALALRGLLAEYPPKLFKTPEKILKALNLAIASEENDFLFVTMWCGCLNLNSRNLTFSSAGSPPAVWITGESEPKGFKKKSLPLGLEKKFQYSSKSAILNPEGCLYLMSDGAFEIELACSGHYLSWEGLKKLLSRQDYLTPHEALGEPEETKNLLVKLAKDQRLLDDFSLLKISLDFKKTRS